MQKLIWQNANGEELNLTSGNYGITEWEGFSNTSLNIQSQQVPFQDGGVFLDALMEQRELSVTLAMNDGGNLETRYRLRRELIHILNPKLGEGYLIYTNDFISKRIKCVAQIPLFETHNSNDSGTPKASLAWTACEPYWEDLEEITVPLVAGVRKTVVNNGDVPCGVNINLLTTNATNPQIKNFKENKLIKLEGSFQDNININTDYGQKMVVSEKMSFEYLKENFWKNTVTYAENIGLFVAIGGYHTIITSSDGINWDYQKRYTSSGTIWAITYSESLGLFVAVGDLIITSSDGINWTERTSGVSNVLNGITYSENLGLFIAVGRNGTIRISSNGINWTFPTSGVSKFLYAITYSENLGLFVVVGNSGTVITSSDGNTWISRTSGVTNSLRAITYSENLGLFIAVGDSGTVVTSSDGINWTEQTSGITLDLKGITYSESLGLFVVFSDRKIYTSKDITTWIERVFSVKDYAYLRGIVFSKNQNRFVIVGGYTSTTNAEIILTSANGENWDNVADEQLEAVNKIAYSNKMQLYVLLKSRAILTSSDLINWTERTSINLRYFINIVYSESLNLFVIIGSSGLIYTSSDGINWTERTSGVSNDLNGITYSENLGLFIAVGDSGTVVTSSDGINWTEQTIGSLYNLRAITYSENLGLFVAVGLVTYNVASAFTSSDGINWTERTFESISTNLNGITYSENLKLFVAVGDNGTIITSSDGINWTERTSGTTNNFNNIIYSDKGGMFVAVTQVGFILISTDGMNWVVIVSGISPVLNGITYSDYFVITGGSALIKSFYESNENLISSLSNDSDMTFSLQINQNQILLGKKSGNLNGTLSYRQKYIGV